jgi:gag-polypeptide of LTR copia-type
MAPATPPIQPNFNLRSVLEKEKLNGINFMVWYRTLRIMLKQEKKEHVLDVPLPESPADGASRATRDIYQTYLEDTLNASNLMLLSMTSELQKRHEDMDAYDMIVSLKSMFENQMRVERYEISRSLFGCKLAEGDPVSPHMINMIGRIESLEKLG